jgi:SAM-dependent methyltransferase
MLVFRYLLVIANVNFSPSSASSIQHQSAAAYTHARLVRAQDGHEAAQGLYQQLLTDHPSDRTAASYIAASPHSCVRQDAACCGSAFPTVATEDGGSSISDLRSLLEANNYTNAAIQRVLQVPPKLHYASCPVYAAAAAAGSEQFPPLPQNGLEALVALFLLGITLPIHVVEQQFGDTVVQLLQKLGLAFVEDGGSANEMVLVPYVHLFPLELPNGKTLWLTTDLHPRCLSTTTVGTSQHHAVMYIGPDSLALVQHLLPSATSNKFEEILDICTGSGIQALSCLLQWDGIKRATCIDINPRALKFVRFNAALNGIEDERLRLVLGDVVTGEFSEVGADEASPSTADELFPDGSVDLLLANPPFIPVPDDDEGVLKRYGLFSSGGADGEVVLMGILQLASRVLNKDERSLIGIVSEFMNPNSIELRRRLHEWCPGTGILLTNEFPVSAETYAARRADSEGEFAVWKQHLERLKITDVSPGLLFLQPRVGNSVDAGNIQLRLVPKTDQGSIWTPWNEKAVEFTQQVLAETLKTSIR